MSENSAVTVTPVNADAAVNAVKYAVKARGTWAAYVKENGVTRETVKVHAAALASLAFPNDKPVQKVDGERTRYGNAVQAAGYGMRAALGKADPTAAEADYIKAVIKAIDNGVTHNLDAAVILDAVESHIASLLS